MIFWVIVGAVTVMLVTLGLRDSDEPTTKGAILLVGLAFLGVMGWLWITR